MFRLCCRQHTNRYPASEAPSDLQARRTTPDPARHSCHSAKATIIHSDGLFWPVSDRWNTLNLWPIASHSPSCSMCFTSDRRLGAYTLRRPRARLFRFIVTE